MKVELVDFQGAIELDKHGRVAIHFTRPLDGLVMDVDQAVVFAKAILETVQPVTSDLLIASRLPQPGAVR